MPRRATRSNKIPWSEEKAIFRRNRGILSTSKALSLGIHPRTLYQMRDAGAIQRLGRGVYCLSDKSLDNFDLVSAALNVPNGVICLISSLSFHELTTEIPHEIYVAVERGWKPQVKGLPIRIFMYNRAVFRSGIETHELDGVKVRIYNKEKTIADCFKFRNKIGMDVTMEALKLYLKGRRRNVDALLQHARANRVERVIRPYLESLM